MTAKAKANELIKKFTFEFTEMKDGYFLIKAYMIKETAKQCALICAEQMLLYLEVPSDDYKFWQEVKSELEKL